MTTKDTLAIGPGTEITMHFKLEVASGEEIDSTFDDEPASFVVGDGNLLPGFETAIFGLQAGDKKTVIIPPEDGFGQRNPNNIQIMDTELFANINLEEGLVLSFGDANNAERPGVVVEFNDNEVTIDFNHPLAGQEIHFSVDVHEVKPSVTH